MVPIEQRVTAMEGQVRALTETNARLLGEVERMLARLDDVQLNGFLSLGELSGVRPSGRRKQRERNARDMPNVS